MWALSPTLGRPNYYERPAASLLLCSRQSGKSTVTALMALWVALFEAPGLVVIVSPTQRQSAEMFRTLMEFHSTWTARPASNAESVLKAEFANGSRILALPGTEDRPRPGECEPRDRRRGHRVEDELLAAVRP